VLAEGRRDAAVELCIRLAGSSEEDIAPARSSPLWPGLEAIAHTLAGQAHVADPTALAAVLERFLGFPGAYRGGGR
jgi:hypothetical protein